VGRSDPELFDPGRSEAVVGARLADQRQHAVAARRVDPVRREPAVVRCERGWYTTPPRRAIDAKAEPTPPVPTTRILIPTRSDGRP
jgi:hypothetical protein